jgi:hypothetical protein
MVKEYYRVKESRKGQFAGVRMNYHVWRRRFIATVHSQRRICSKTQLSSLKSVRTFRTVEDQDVTCTGNKGAVHQVELEGKCVFKVHEDTILKVFHHMLKSGGESGRQVRESEDCDGKEKSSRRRLALRSNCASGPVMSNGPCVRRRRRCPSS